MPPTKRRPFEYFSVAADVMALRERRGRLEILLIQRKNPPYQFCWALPGGFLEKEEDGLTAARREFLEETGLKASRLEEFGSFSDPHRDPRGRVVTLSYFTLLPWSRSEPQAGDDAQNARWFSARRLPELAFDHKEMIRIGLGKFLGRKKQRPRSR